MSFSFAKVRIRRMSAADLERVVEIAESLQQAPHWAASVYVAAMNPENLPRRVALVAEWDSGDEQDSSGVFEKRTAGAEHTVERHSALKGHAFSRATGRPTGDSALGVGGIQRAEKTFPQGLKPNFSLVPPDGTAKAVPFQGGGFDSQGRVVVGFAVAVLIPPQAELETIAVAGDGQRRGVGGLLLRALAGELRAADVRELNLEVRASNQAALGFYRTHGFEECWLRRRYYGDPEEDAVLMRLRLA